MNRTLAAAACLALLLGLSGCRARHGTSVVVNAPYPVFLGKPLAIGGRPIVHTNTGRTFERENYHRRLGSSSTRQTGWNEETVTTYTERESGRTGKGGAQHSAEFVADATIYCGRYMWAPGAVIIPVVISKVYAGVEGKIVQQVGKK